MKLLFQAMASAKNKSPIYGIVLSFVYLIIAGAFVVSGAAFYENIRFESTVSQVLSFTQKVRGFVGEQPGLLLRPGDDLWASMVSVGQISSELRKTNSWDGEFQAIAMSNATMRIETVLPSRSCRRMATHFMGLNSADSNLLSIEAQPDKAVMWSVLYASGSSGPFSPVTGACGWFPLSRIAFVFKIR